MIQVPLIGNEKGLFFLTLLFNIKETIAKRISMKRCHEGRLLHKVLPFCT